MLNCAIPPKWPTIKQLACSSFLLQSNLTLPPGMASMDTTEVSCHRLKDYKRTTKESDDTKSARKLLARIKLTQDRRESEFAKRRMVGVNQDDRSLEEGDVLGDNSDVEDSQMSQGLVEEDLMQEEVEQDEQTPGGSDCDEDGKEDDINKEKKENDPYTQEKLEAKAKLLYLENDSDLLEPVVYFRKFLGVVDPPISKVIDLNILPRFVQLLSCAKDPALHFEVSWVVTNIASGDSKYTQQIVDAGAVPALIEILSLDNYHQTDQALWALGNIVGDGAELRDYVLDHGIVPAILKFDKDLDQMPIKFFNTLSWVISNLCRFKPYPAVEKVAPLLGMMKEIVISKRSEAALHDIYWAFSFISDGGDNNIQVVIDSGICLILVDNLKDLNTPEMTMPVVRTFGSIASGNNDHTQFVVDLGVLEHLERFIGMGNENLDKEVFWLISNVLAGKQEHIQRVIDCNLMGCIVSHLSEGSLKVRKECCWCVGNMLFEGNPDQKRYAVSLGCLPPFCALLEDEDNDIVQCIVEALNSLLKSASGQPDRDFYVSTLEEAGDQIGVLIGHLNEVIAQCSESIIEICGESKERDEGTVD